MADSEKNIRAFLAIEPPEDILQAVIPLAGKIESGKSAAGSAGQGRRDSI
ncbi:MAG: hypothetical protein MZV70_36715 [Desulfobacterales bacterium]|nr:hypothetical protein [Desulfobacterales bacterium]